MFTAECRCVTLFRNERLRIVSCIHWQNLSIKYSSTAAGSRSQHVRIVLRQPLPHWITTSYRKLLRSLLIHWTRSGLFMSISVEKVPRIISAPLSLAGVR